MEYHRQCSLRKNDYILTTWLPEKLRSKSIKVGNVVKIKGHDEDDWDSGWEIFEIGMRMKSEDVVDERQNHKNWRSITDI